MAIFDPVEQRMCVRIVYDGAGGAGKTTNLRSLCSLFATQHTTELFSPGELDGRTLYFDWVQIMAGVVCGFPLMCQVISVPGQTVLTPRRRHLLATADVVVLVCDSSPAGVDRAREGLHLVAEASTGRGTLPIVIQANKQDQLRAVPGPELARRLGCEGSPVIEAIATEGIGVVDTFVNAVRAVSKAMLAQSEREGLRVAVGRAPVAADLLERLERCEVDPEWAAEMFLEEVHASMLIAGGADRSAAEIEAARRAPPVLPQADVETGFIWPAHTGRMVLAKLASHAGPEQTLAIDAAGRGEVVLDGYRLRTSTELRFEDREEARQALVRAARERTQLERLLAPETVLVAQPARDGAWWLWTLQALVPMLPGVMTSTPERQPSLLKDYAVAIADVVRTCLRNDIAVSLDPDSFGLSDGSIRYIGDIAATANVTSLGAAMLDAMAAARRLGWDVTRLSENIEDELRLRLTRDEIARATVLG